MRPHCKECVLKHLGQASALMDETLLGYPLHKVLAIGHMAEAESESLGRWPALSQRIRDERKIYEAEGGVIDIMELIGKAMEVRDDEVL